MAGLLAPITLTGSKQSIFTRCNQASRWQLAQQAHIFKPVHWLLPCAGNINGTTCLVHIENGFLQGK